MIQLTKLTYFLIPLLIIFGVLCIRFYQKFKVDENRKLAIIYNELASEKTIAHQLKNAPQEIENIDISINNKLINIKVEILNIDFTLTEIFS